MMPPAIASSGLTERMTRVNCQPLTKPTRNPAMKAQKYWKNNDNLSPIPASIWSTSLEQNLIINLSDHLEDNPAIE